MFTFENFEKIDPTAVKFEYHHSDKWIIINMRQCSAAGSILLSNIQNWSLDLKMITQYSFTTFTLDGLYLEALSVTWSVEFFCLDLVAEKMHVMVMEASRILFEDWC